MLILESPVDKSGSVSHVKTTKYNVKKKKKNLLKITLNLL